MVHPKAAVPEEEEEHDYESLPPNFSVAQNMAAGAIAGIAEHSLMYPVDAIKTRMQLMNSGRSATYDGGIRGIMRMSTTEGFMSLWRGVSSVVVGAGPAHAVYFATYETVKQAMGGNVAGTHNPLAAATSGGCATLISDAMMNPFDVIKQRMQMQNSSRLYPSILSCARQVYRYEGLRAFYASYPTTLSMTVPFTALQFTVYESTSTFLNPTKGYDPVAHCVAGAAGGGVAAALTTPMDVVKTMLQTRGATEDVALRNVSGFSNACRIVYERAGLAGFFKGVRPRVMTAMPSTAICFGTYEAFKAYFIQSNEISDRESPP